MVIAFLAAVSAAGAAVFGNGDFEKGAEGWVIGDRRVSVAESAWRIVDGAGIDGSKAIVVDVKEGEPFHYLISTNFPVEAGTKYRFDTYMRNEGFKIGYGQLCISFGCLDANRRELTGYRAIVQDDNVVGRDGWTHYATDTMPLPKNAVYGRFCVWAPQVSCSGKMTFDDFQVVQTDSRPGVNAVHTSAYRDTAVDGTLRLAAEYFANAVKYPEESLRGRFVFEGDGGTLEVPAASFGGGVAEATVDLARLPFGDYRLSFLVAAKSGEKLGAKTIPFRRVRELPKRKVWIDGHNRTIVDGRPFFPLGMYWQRITEEHLRAYTNGQFNCLITYRSPSRETFDLAWKHGVRLIYPSQGHYAAFAGKPEKEAAYLAERMAFRDHPALLAWYLCDELSLSLVPNLVARNLAFRAEDPDHPTWQVLNYPDKARDFMDGADVIGCDPYPIGCRHDGTSAPIGIASSSPEKLVAGCYGMRPMWNVPQAFNWGWYRKELADRPGVRMPTREEIANMAWQSVAAGSNGLIFYSFFDVMEREKDPVRREAIWQDVASVGREVKRWERVLLSDPSELVLGGVPQDRLAVRVWKCADEQVALIVNRTQAAVKATLGLPRKAAGISVKGSSVALSGDGRSLDVDFAALGYAFVRFTEKD